MGNPDGSHCLVGSPPGCHAHSAEIILYSGSRLTLNLRVEGSSPSAPTSKHIVIMAAGFWLACGCARFLPKFSSPRLIGRLATLRCPRCSKLWDLRGVGLVNVFDLDRADREGLRALCAFVFAQKLTDQIVRENHKFGRSGVDLKSPRRMGAKRRSLFTIVFCVLFPLGANAQPGPHPPCESASPFPDFAPPGQVPNYRVWIKNQWVLPACTGWTARTGRLVAIAGQFRYTGTADDLLLEVGAISTLKGIRYWSVTENSWRTLITSA